MSKRILTAAIAIVQIGRVKFEGLMDQEGNYYVAVPQLVTLDLIPPDRSLKQLQAILRKPFQFDKLKTALHPKAVNAIPLSQVNEMIQILALKGNAKAQKFLYGEVIKGKSRNASSDHVYVIGDEDRNVCKIGIAKDPGKRMRGIQTGYPFTLSLLFVKRVTNARKKEWMLHKALSDYRLNGEWFEMDALNFVNWDTL